MREEGGISVIKTAINKLAAKHKEHMAMYGEGNELRMTGALETSSMEEFSCGVANRGCSVRIGRDTEAEGKGYFEDRRPSSNCDPYILRVREEGEAVQGGVSHRHSQRDGALARREVAEEK